MKYTAPRGTRDILPVETPLWQFVEDSFRQLFSLHSYKEIRTPIFEQTDLFARSIGGSTDIVKKEMYTFLDRKGRNLALRPEETAAVVRAGIENNLLSHDKLVKLYYFGPMFRYERPQAGRQRQFHQAGIEAFGSDDPALDAEVISLSKKLFEKIGLAYLSVELNSVGCSGCQDGYRSAVRHYFEKQIDAMCFDCKERVKTNPVRILDCKEANCQKFIKNAPLSVDHLCLDCENHFAKVKEWLDLIGIEYRVNNRLVRGLDYYTRTAFEVVSSQLGAQNAVCGGGRYDKLAQELGGKPVPAIGFAVGLERTVELVGKSNREISCFVPDLFIATIGEEAKKQGFSLLAKARDAGIGAEMDYQNKNLKSQMKIADRLKAKHVLIIGEDEIEKKSAVLKDMRTGEQTDVAFADLLKWKF